MEVAGATDIRLLNHGQRNRAARDAADVEKRDNVVALSEQFTQKIVTRHGLVRRHVAKDAGECADLQGIVQRHGDVVLAAAERGQAQVASRLMVDSITEFRERGRERPARQVSRQLHDAMTSSLTK